MDQGHRLADRYELTERLGTGGMATVWKARDHSLGREVAVKVLHPALVESGDHGERFRREARNAAGLSHPNIVTVYDTGTEDDAPYIVMEYIPGRTLHDLLRTQGPLPVAQTARVGREVLAGLDHAHQRGLVHRDVKPGNVLLDEEGQVKVADFGIAKGLAEASNLTRTGTMMGTASYLSPEQGAGREATPASDLYALGCVLHECLAGRPPFQADSPVATALQHQQATPPDLRRLRPDVPTAFAAVIDRALEKDPGRRYRSAREMDAAIAKTGLADAPDAAPMLVFGAGDEPTAALDSAPTAAGAEPTAAVTSGPGHTESIPTPPERPNRMRRLVAATAAVLLVAAAAFIGAFLATGGPTDTETPSPTPAETTPEAPAVAPVSSPTPEPTPEPTPTPEPEQTRTPRPPRTPDVDVPAVGEDPTPAPTPTATPSPTPLL